MAPKRKASTATPKGKRRAPPQRSSQDDTAMEGGDEQHGAEAELVRGRR